MKINIGNMEVNTVYYNIKKIVLSPTTSSLVELYGYGNAGRAASRAWRAMGDQGFGVREVTVSKSGGTAPFSKVSVQYRMR